MRSSSLNPTELSATKVVAPDDIHAGDYVSVVSIVDEYPSFLWCGDSDLQPRETPVMIRSRPRMPEAPLKVLATCLPFILVQQRSGRCRQLDVRSVQLARVDPGYAKLAIKMLRKHRKKKGK